LVGSGGVGGTVNQIQQGISVDLSADGNTAVVGGNGDDDLAGAIWIWVRSGGSWSQQGSKLVVVDAVGKASHGRAVSMTDDGNMVIAGGRADDSSAGAAWIWIRSGGTWSQYGSKLVGSSAVGKAEQGFAVSLSGDGSTTISSGRLDDGSVGAVWIFVRSPPGAFGKISPANGAAGQSSGPTLSWGTSTAAEHYEYCYDLTNDNACSEWTRTSTITSVVVSVTDNTTLYWHVRAVNGGGTTYADGNAGAFWGFATQVVQGNTSSVISPSNGATGEPTRRRPPQMSLDADISGDAFHNASSGLWFKFLDFDGDGADELFLYSAATGAWFQMISDGVGGFIVVGNQTWTTGWQLYPTDLDSDRRTGLLLVHPASGVWYQARNLLRGSFDYSSGFWAPGLTIITRAPSR
jgi:hypothetical protein